MRFPLPPLLLLPSPAFAPPPSHPLLFYSERGSPPMGINKTREFTWDKPRPSTYM